MRMNNGHRYQKCFATGSVPDGYYGDFAKVDFYYDMRNGKTIVKAPGIYFTYHTPPAEDIYEAYWLLKNHPSSNAKFVTRTR